MGLRSKTPRPVGIQIQGGQDLQEPKQLHHPRAHTTLVDRCQALPCHTQSEELCILLPPLPAQKKQNLDPDSQDVMPLADRGWQQALNC